MIKMNKTLKTLLTIASGCWLAGLVLTARPAMAQDPAPAPAPDAAAAPAPQATPTPQELAIRDNVNYHMVAIEALVVEVNEDRTRDLGLSYGFNEVARPDGTTPGIINGADIRMGRALSPVRVPVLLPGQAGTDNGIGFQNHLPGLGITLQGMNVSTGVISARLRALMDTGDAAIRTRPVAVALNKTKVTIEAVDEIPYQNVANNNALIISNDKVGVKMYVTPTIVGLRPGVAQLNIENIEVSSVSQYMTTNNIERPVFNKSATSTMVTLGEGETFVVGSLKSRQKVHYEDRVPILGHIPIIDWFFSSKQDKEANVDVLFFVTPHILSPGENFLLPFDFKNQKALGIEDAGLSKW